MTFTAMATAVALGVFVGGGIVAFLYGAFFQPNVVISFDELEEALEDEINNDFEQEFDHAPAKLSKIVRPIEKAEVDDEQDDPKDEDEDKKGKIKIPERRFFT